MSNNNYIEKWNAIVQEMDARADKINAETRLKYNDAMKNFSEEVNAGADWLEADWDEFTARVTKWWNDFQITIDEASK
ncbi:MAG: hypothetical protein MRY57_04240 [Candidatus Pacebacteria bacterium]|nr:hypothetical protein [Candidatus Paceibacterota bacterium]